MARYDAIILGLGAMGSAAAYQFARRGARVLGIDRFVPPHTHGSSHGDTRITRLAIGEGGHYTPLAMRSHEIWREIERETGADLLTQCGGLIISSEKKASFMHVKGFFGNTVAAAREHGIAHELLDAREIRSRYPAFNVRDDEVGYFEPAAGFLRPEACVRANLALARKHGAELRIEEPARGFECSPNDVTVTTAHGRYSADRLVVAVGAWVPDFLDARYAGIFRVYRQVLCWFDVDSAESFMPGRFPIFIWELQGSAQGIYGFPAIDGATGGIKTAVEQFRDTVPPDSKTDHVDPDEIARMYRACVAPHLRGVRETCVRTATCLYTVTPDFGFVVDRLDEAGRVMLVSACSGHGFKHSAAIGEAVAETMLAGRSRLDLEALRLCRFA